MDPRITLVLIILGFLFVVASSFQIWSIVTEKWIRREYEYRVKSSHMIYRWLCIGIWLRDFREAPNKSENFDWYNFYLNDSPRGPKRYTHISQVWRQKDEYEYIVAYLEEHKKDWEDYAEWAIQSGIFSSEFAVSIL
jgi:hypothetical protein